MPVLLDRARSELLAGLGPEPLLSMVKHRCVSLV